MRINNSRDEELFAKFAKYLDDSNEFIKLCERNHFEYLRSVSFHFSFTFLYNIAFVIFFARIFYAKSSSNFYFAKVFYSTEVKNGKASGPNHL